MGFGIKQTSVPDKDTEKQEGSIKEIQVSDDNSQGLLNQILKQMKIMNFHLSLITDSSITKEEIDA